jgi:aryl-alcohol dehydrogenase-like predicted oxidoreductase/predicted kinase
MSIAPGPQGWLRPEESRIGLGCMRLSTDDDGGDEVAAATVAAALEAGITVFDTAHSYGRGERDLGHNEQLLARALRSHDAHRTARIVTKGGLTRVGGAWIPDGRARAIRGDCAASLAALDGLPIDLYLLHVPDPRVPWATSVRALRQLLDDGLVRRIGVSNVNRSQLDEALEIADIAAVEIALSVRDDGALRGGIVERCVDRGIAVIAHSPLGGPRRARSLDRDLVLRDVAVSCAATTAEVALAWLLDLAPSIVPIPGSRRPETARSSARAAELRLDAASRATLRRTFGSLRPDHIAPPRSAEGAEVVIVAGIPGAGKSRIARRYVAEGYRRLNRDQRGGSLRDIAISLDEELRSGARRIVLDNTYLTAAARSRVIETAHRHGIPARCLWLDTPLAQAQVNLVARLLDRFGALPEPDDLRAAARREPGLLAPTAQMRAFRDIEPPSADEGFVAVELVPFTREPASVEQRAGVFIAAAALARPGWSDAITERNAPCLVYEWSPGGAKDDVATAARRLSTLVSGVVEVAVCAHGGGPPVCWCRPPLPGLPLLFARRHGIDPAGSLLIGTGPAHRTLANALGARYAPV